LLLVPDGQSFTSEVRAMQRLRSEMRHAATTIPALLRRWPRVPGPWLFVIALVVPFGWLAPVCRLALTRVQRAPRR
jgi:hypothetical protein